MNTEQVYHGFLLGVCMIMTVMAGFFLASCGSSGDGIPDFTISNTGPYILNTSHLRLIKENRDHPEIRQAYTSMLEGADELLDQPFEFVTDKEYTPPSGNKHDYMSIARYWHVDTTDTGISTYYNESKSNPLIDKFDRPRLARFSSGVYSLALAYYLSDDEKYAKKAVELLKGWFFSPETRMKPNMDFTQVKLGISGSGGGGTQGIIDANDFVPVIEAAGLLYDSPHWTGEDHVELKKWFYAFSSWVTKNYNADAHCRPEWCSNISTWLDVQRAAYFLFTEQEHLLNSASHVQSVSDKISMQISPVGIQVYEKQRAASQHYVYFNLRGYMNLALLRKNRTGHDRDWPVLSSANYGGLKPAIDALISYVEGAAVSKYFDPRPEFDTCRYLEIFKPAAIAFQSELYEQAANELISRGCLNPDIILAYPPLEWLHETEPEKSVR